MIPPQTLQAIEERLDIVEVIHGYTPLKRAGKNFKALCPFHPEKTPSFMVYPQKQFFICYGCGAGGDMVAFVMRFEHLEFPEAVRVLAQKAGVPVKEVAGSGRASQANPELYRAHEVAARFYHELLMASPEGEVARAYLKGRGLHPEMWKVFQLGLAPHGWDRLLSYVREENLPPELLEKAGLVIPREGGEGWYDRFRHRVIFPIWDPKGKVIGFGGRTLQETEPAKYMNSPETELYVKGRVLYGLNRTATYIREKDFCIVVEGYMDLITPFQHGIRNLVASMGTSLTPEQVRLIRRLTRHVVIVYDGDYAGQMATLRGLDLFLEAQMRVKVTSLPKGEDPDSLIQSQGVQALAKAIQGSQDLFDYKLDLLKREFNPQELEGRVQICQEMLPTIKRVPNAIQRGEYIKQLAQALKVEERLLWSELARVKLEATSWRPLWAGQAPPKAVGSAEELLAGLLLEQPTWIDRLRGRLEPESLRDPQVKRLIDWMKKQSEEGVTFQGHQELFHAFPRDSQEWDSRLARWLALADTVEEKERAFEEVLHRIQGELRRYCLTDLQNAIRQAETSQDETKTAQLILQYNRLMKRGSLASRSVGA